MNNSCLIKENPKLNKKSSHKSIDLGKEKTNNL